jgi:acetylornithine deacetylase
VVPGVAAHAAHRLEGVSAIDRYVPVHRRWPSTSARSTPSRAPAHARARAALSAARRAPSRRGSGRAASPTGCASRAARPVRVGEDVEAARAASRRPSRAPARRRGCRGPAASSPRGRPIPRTPSPGSSARDERRAGREVAVGRGAVGRRHAPVDRARIPTVMVGTPGIELAHAVDERVRVDDLLPCRAPSRACARPSTLRNAIPMKPSLSLHVSVACPVFSSCSSPRGPRRPRNRPGAPPWSAPAPSPAPSGPRRRSS